MIYWYISIYVIGVPMLAAGLYPIGQRMGGNPIDWNQLVGGALLFVAGLWTTILLVEKALDTARIEAVARAL